MKAAAETATAETSFGMLDAMEHRLHNGRFADVSTTNGLTQAIIYRINFDGGFVQRVNVVSVRGHFATNKGMPDVVGMYRGAFVGVEIKTGRDKQSEQQQEWQRRCEIAGGRYFIARQWEQFAREWQEYKAQRRDTCNQLVKLGIKAKILQVGSVQRQRAEFLSRLGVFVPKSMAEDTQRSESEVRETGQRTKSEQRERSEDEAKEIGNNSREEVCNG